MNIETLISVSRPAKKLDRQEVQTGLRTEMISSTEGLLAIREEWEALFRASHHTNPFARWPWTFYWWKRWGQPQGDRLNIITLRDKAHKLQSIIPLIHTSHVLFEAVKPTGRVIPGGGILEIKPLIISPGWEKTASEALVEVLSAQDPHYHWADVAGIPLDQHFSDWWRNDPRQSFRIDNSYFLLPLPPTWDQFRQHLSRNTKESIRKSHAKLRRDGHQVEFEVVKDPEAVQVALDEFFKLHTVRSKMKNAPYHRDYFVTETHRDYLRDVARNWPDTGFQVARLRINGKVEASRVLLEASDHLYLYYSGFNTDLWGYSVMHRLTTEIMKMAIANPAINTINLSVGKDDNKLRWDPEEHFFGSFRFVPNNHQAETMYLIASLLGLIRRRPI